MNANLALQTIGRKLSPFERLLNSYTPISLAEMAHVSLLDRIDTKYVLPLSQLYPVLASVQPAYRILDIEHNRLNRYHTVYFDEADFTFYNQHHNHHANRYKVRARQYVDTHTAFFEVKHKTNKQRTLKSRLPLPYGLRAQEAEVSAFVDEHVAGEHNTLEAKLWNDYLRVTLVGIERLERVTVDLDLSFGQHNLYTDLPGIAIVEVKQAAYSQQSSFIQHMRQRGFRPMSFSKYCAGVYLLYDGVKTNAFKPVMRQVQRLVCSEGHHASPY